MSDQEGPLRRTLAGLLDRLYGLNFRPGHLDAVMDVIHLHAPMKEIVLPPSDHGDQDRLAEHNRTVLARVKCSEFGWDGKDCRSELPVVFSDWCRHCLMQEVAYRTQEIARLKAQIETSRPKFVVRKAPAFFFDPED